MSQTNDAHIPDWNEVRASLAQAATFSWTRTARDTLRLLRRLAGHAE